MRAFALLAPLLAAPLLILKSAAQSAPQQHVFARSCEQFLPKAEAFLQDHGWKLGASGTCTSCVVATTDALRDANGHRLLSRGGIVRSYTTRTVREKPPGPAWIVHSPIHVAAKLALEPAPTACKAILNFEYTWYGIELILGFPVDGDPDGAPSNGRLEGEYLRRLNDDFTGSTKSPSR